MALPPPPATMHSQTTQLLDFGNDLEYIVGQDTVPMFDLATEMSGCTAFGCSQNSCTTNLCSDHTCTNHWSRHKERNNMAFAIDSDGKVKFTEVGKAPDCDTFGCGSNTCPDHHCRRHSCVKNGCSSFSCNDYN